MQTHAAVAANLTEDAETVGAICDNPSLAPISEKERALFAFLEKVNDAAHSVTREDIEAARGAGLSDKEIFDGVTVCAAFNFLNRWVSATGVEAMPPGFWEQYLAAEGDLHYATEPPGAAPPADGVDTVETPGVSPPSAEPPAQEP